MVPDAVAVPAPPEPDRRVVVVSHGMTGRVLRGAYARFGPDGVFALEPADLGRPEQTRVGACLRRLGFVARRVSAGAGRSRLYYRMESL